MLSLALRLPDDSLTVALATGGREHFGWGLDRHILADVFDALQNNTKATGNWKKGKPPELPMWPRPKADKKKAAKPEKRKPVSVADVYKLIQRR